MPSRKFSTLYKFKGKRRRTKTDCEKKKSSTDDLDKPFDSGDLDLKSDSVDSDDSKTDPDINSTTTTSATEKKLDLFQHQSFKEEGICGYRLVDVNFIKSLVSQLSCPRCNKSLQTSTLQEDNSKGLCSKFDVVCSNCEAVISSAATSPRLSEEENYANGAFDVNRRSVLAMKELGGGKADLDKLSRVFDMPSSLGKEAFCKHLKKIEAASSESVQSHLKTTADLIRKAYSEIHPNYADQDIIDIDVVADGTWQKRGFSSKYNVTVITDLLTGLALDFEVLTNYCAVCAKNKLDKGSPEYAEWFEDHKSNCQINHVGSSKSMETEATLRMFTRSIEKYGFRYTHLLNDGDSSVFRNILALNDGAGPYGRDHPVVNEDCVNHISKRMKNSLDTQIAKLKAEGEPIDGKGRLTKDRVRAIQNYYGRAIKDNAGDLEGMQRSTWAIYLHYFDDEDNQHHKCPSGSDSWCWYQRQVATGVSTPRRGDHTAPLPPRVSQAILSVFERLCSKTLLSGCLRGATQNANESFNQLIWKRAPKHRFTSLESVRHAVNMCCMEFNRGSTSTLTVMENAGIIPTPNAERFCLKRDIERKRQSIIQGTERFKKIRKSKELENV